MPQAGYAQGRAGLKVPTPMVLSIQGLSFLSHFLPAFQGTGNSSLVIGHLRGTGS